MDGAPRLFTNGFLPFRPGDPRPGYGVHLRANLIEQAHLILIDCIEIEEGAIWNVGEVWVGVEAVEDGFELVRGAIEVEGVGGAYEKMDAAFQAGTTFGPVRLDNMREIVVIVPVGDHFRMDVSGLMVEHLHRRAAVRLG